MSMFASRIRPYVRAELDASAAAEREGMLELAFRRLERAHVLAQSAPLQHTFIHWQMYRFALRHRLHREAIGQWLRLLLAAPLTMFGAIPTGNTGGSAVSGFKSMPIPADLQQSIDAARTQSNRHRTSSTQLR